MGVSTLDTLTTAIDELLAVDVHSIDDTGLHELVVELGRQSSRLEAAWCGLIRSWDRRQIWADNGSKAPGARLARDTHLRKSDANRLVRRGRALGSMPLAAVAYQAGEINGDHVDLIATCNTSWPNADFAESEQMLVNSCTTAWFDNATRAVDYWKQLADRDGADTRALDHREGRHASIATGWRGEVVLNGVFDPVSGEIFKTELDRICEQLRRQDEREGTLRTVQQRRADALVEMAMRSATAPADGLRPRPLFTVTIGIDPFSWLCETAAGTVIAPSLLVPLLGDADIERIVYDPPNRKIEASHRRSFTGAVRRIIEVRDRHCQHESGCDQPAPKCDADHIVPWSETRFTCICNGQLLCATHNRVTKNHGHRPPLTEKQRHGDPLALSPDTDPTWTASDTGSGTPAPPRAPPQAG